MRASPSHVVIFCGGAEARSGSLTAPRQGGSDPCAPHGSFFQYRTPDPTSIHYYQTKHLKATDFRAKQNKKASKIFQPRYFTPPWRSSHLHPRPAFQTSLSPATTQPRPQSHRQHRRLQLPRHLPPQESSSAEVPALGHAIIHHEQLTSSKDMYPIHLEQEFTHFVRRLAGSQPCL